MSSANATLTSPPPHHSSGDDGTAVGIRVPTGPDPMFDGDVTTPSDVWRLIDEAKRGQAQSRGNVDLFPRRWRTMTSPTARTTRTGDGSRRSPDSAAGGFTAMQFNALAEGLSSGPADVRTPFPPSSSGGASWLVNDYGGFTPSVPNPEMCLDFELRRWRILEVVLSSYPGPGGGGAEDAAASGLGPGPDLLAMEEVEHFADFFLPALRLFGYSSQGLFRPKPSSPSAKLGWYSDGTALLWKEGAFDLLSGRTGGYAAGNGNQGYAMATLRHRGSGRVVVTAATHLKSKPGVKNEALRTGQAEELLDIVSVEASAVAATTFVDPAVVIMGDFNAEPPGVPGSTCVPALLSGRRLTLRSAYPEVVAGGDGAGWSRHYTTWKTRGNGPTVCRVIDYVFHGCLTSPAGDGAGGVGGVVGETRAGMRCARVLDVPDAAVVDDEDCGGLIGFRYPSDHAAIAARFEFVVVDDGDENDDVEEVET